MAVKVKKAKNPACPWCKRESQIIKWYGKVIYRCNRWSCHNFLGRVSMKPVTSEDWE